jgi:hypothetical protein
VASATFVIWLLTALVGAYMAGVAMGLGRPVGDPANTHWPSWLMFVHATAAVVGLTLWIFFMTEGYRLLAWLSFADLVLVAGLGDVLLVTWLRDRRAERRAEGADPDRVKTVRNYVPRPQQGRVQAPAPERVPVTALEERRIPSIAVAVHGLLALGTMVMVLLCALGVGT